MQKIKPCRMHITGAPGAGATSLGRALAGILAAPHFDSDDFLWMPTSQPYSALRPKEERLALMQALFAGGPRWILSGSLNSWGDALIPCFDHVIFLTTPTPLRLQRLFLREQRRFGAKAVAAGGWRHEALLRFLDYASGYDDGRAGRNLALHEAWLAKLPCPVLRLDGAQPLADLCGKICQTIE